MRTVVYKLLMAWLRHLAALTSSKWNNQLSSVFFTIICFFHPVYFCSIFMHYFHIWQKEANKTGTGISVAKILHVLILIKGFNRAELESGMQI